MIYPKLITGKTVELRHVTPDDSSFIIKLRTDEKNKQHIGFTDIRINKQYHWIVNQLDKPNDYYFIYSSLKTNDKIGTISIYNLTDEFAEIGRWVSFGNQLENVEAFYLAIIFAFKTLLLKKIYSKVRAGNLKIISFHERILANYIGNELNNNHEMQVYEIDVNNFDFMSKLIETIIK